MTTVAADLRRYYSAHPTGVAVVAALVAGRPVGMAAASFVPVSLDPPLVSLCMAHTSTSWPVLRDVPRIGISILGAEQGVIGRGFGARDRDRFEGVSWRAADSGAIAIDGAVARFECSASAQHRAGDHDIVVFAVHDLEADPSRLPLVFHASAYRTLS